ncbi:hypothetical protein [Streptomyces pacificus]|uniref:Uncharacterized protein n=1 Tax=Streptomyces pacificus TaxID=2705029 RepID=A0A6A0AUF7_9ACTN|nr:hypothetical protein [Streptomyces pacificus]GFH36542.1 hypothetical protein SCWH03_27710 [Streptomyces pacificus]
MSDVRGERGPLHGGAEDPPVDQMVFRWGGNRGRQGTGMTAVASSCPAERAEEIGRELGSLLWMTGSDEPRPSVVRTIRPDGEVMLVQRWPTTDAVGRRSTVSHVLVGPGGVLKTRLCLGLAHQGWGGRSQAEQVSGRLGPVPVAGLRNLALPRLSWMEGRLAEVEQALVLVAAAWLRDPGIRVSLLVDGSRPPGWPDRESAPLVHLGLFMLFQNWLPARWTFATHDTVDSHPLLLTCVPRWDPDGGGAGPLARLAAGRGTGAEGPEHDLAARLVAGLLVPSPRDATGPALARLLPRGARLGREQRLALLRDVLEEGPRPAGPPAPGPAAVPRARQGALREPAAGQPVGASDRDGRREDGVRRDREALPAVDGGARDPGPPRPVRTAGRGGDHHRDRDRDRDRDGAQRMPQGPQRSGLFEGPSDGSAPPSGQPRHLPQESPSGLGRVPGHVQADAPAGRAGTHGPCRAQAGQVWGHAPSGPPATPMRERLCEALGLPGTPGPAELVAAAADEDLLDELRCPAHPMDTVFDLLDELVERLCTSRLGAAAGDELCTEVLRSGLYLEPADRSWRGEPAAASQREARAAELFSLVVGPRARDPRQREALGSLAARIEGNPWSSLGELLGVLLLDSPPEETPDLPPVLWQALLRDADRRIATPAHGSTPGPAHSAAPAHPAHSAAPAHPGQPAAPAAPVSAPPAPSARPPRASGQPAAPRPAHPGAVSAPSGTGRPAGQAAGPPSAGCPALPAGYEAAGGTPYAAGTAPEVPPPGRERAANGGPGGPSPPVAPSLRAAPPPAPAWRFWEGDVVGPAIVGLLVIVLMALVVYLVLALSG